MEPVKSIPSSSDSRRALEVRKQLDRLLADPAFSGANRRSRLLRYLVEQGLEDRPEALKESVIAAEVFDRAPGYDPQIDSVVRVEIGRLRARLAEYYSDTDPDHAVRIEIPKGGYRPVFVFRHGEPEAPPGEDPPAVSKEAYWSWRRVAWLAAAFVLLIATALWWRTRAGPRSGPASIAVLPFLNLSGSNADEYLGDGISEELTEALSEFNELRVVARTSAFQYKGKNADIREIGRDLRAGAVLEGSVARRDGKLHVVAQLIRSSDGYHLWSRTYDTTLAELPSVEVELARAAREQLSPKPLVEKRAPAPANAEAHDLYIRAAYELNRHTLEGTRQAMELARQVAGKDPGFAQPWVLMAAGESQLNTLMVQLPHTGSERARKDIEKALALDPENSAAHAQRAMLAYIDEWDWPQAETEFRKALAAGSHGSAENLYGWSLMTRGRFSEARQHLQLASELDPLSTGPQLNQVEELLNERSYKEARVKVEQDPPHCPH